jgi:hypothetical protein
MTDYLITGIRDDGTTTPTDRASKHAPSYGPGGLMSRADLMQIVVLNMLDQPGVISATVVKEG